MKTKFYPFSASLIRKLKKEGVFTKAKVAYDRLPDSERAIKGKENDLDCCFIFSQTKEGSAYWWDLHHKITELRDVNRIQQSEIKHLREQLKNCK